VDKYTTACPCSAEAALRAHGTGVPVSTLADQVTGATDLLRPIWAGSGAGVLAAESCIWTGTGLPVLDRSAVGASIWAPLGYVGDTDVAAYLFVSTGKKQGQPKASWPEDMLNLARGYTVADASKPVRQELQARGPRRVRLQHARPSLFR